jgi:Na+-driven multidrug efflux pump
MSRSFFSRQKFLLLAVPMMLELVLEVDLRGGGHLFVGKLGASAVATVGLTETYLFLLYSIAMGLAMAVTAIVARRVGEHRGEARRVGRAGVLLALLVSLPVRVPASSGQGPAALMGADAWAIEHGYRYTQWMLGGNVVILLLFVINAIFRGAGDAAIAMRVLWVANGSTSCSTPS